MIGVFVPFEEERGANGRYVGWIVCENGCWEWTGTTVQKGYGLVWLEGKRHRAHRAVYERLRGPIPTGLMLDHLCRNTTCVNPAHLEPVTNRENTIRGSGPAAQNALKTHCKNGHPFDKGNTRYKPGRAELPYRVCRACSCAVRRARRARSRLLAALTRSAP